MGVKQLNTKQDDETNEYVDRSKLPKKKKNEGTYEEERNKKELIKSKKKTPTRIKSTIFKKMLRTHFAQKQMPCNAQSSLDARSILAKQSNYYMRGTNMVLAS